MIDSNAETIAVLRNIITELEKGALRVNRVENGMDYNMKQMDGKDLSASFELRVQFRRIS